MRLRWSSLCRYPWCLPKHAHGLKGEYVVGDFTREGPTNKTMPPCLIDAGFMDERIYDPLEDLGWKFEQLHICFEAAVFLEVVKKLRIVLAVRESCL